MIREVRDGCGAGFGFGEFLIVISLLFNAVSSGGDENENDDGHNDEDEASCKGRAWSILRRRGCLGHKEGVAFWGGEINGE